MIDEEEYVDIVDEHDKIIGKDTKENKLKKSLISRNVIIFVLDNDKNLLITKRSPHYAMGRSVSPRRGRNVCRRASRWPNARAPKMQRLPWSPQGNRAYGILL